MYLRGRLFSEYYLAEGIRLDAPYSAIPDAAVAELEATLVQHIAAIQAMHRPNEAQTEAELIEPVLALLGWTGLFSRQAPLNQQRSDTPDYLLFPDAAAKATAAALPQPGARFRHGCAVMEVKQWATPLDRGTGTMGIPSSQMLRYLTLAEVQSDRRLRFGILTNGRAWRLYDQLATSRAEDYVELDLVELLRGALPGAQSDLMAPDAQARAHGLRVLLLLFGKPALAPDLLGRARIAEALDANRRYEARLTDNLSGIVFGTVYPGLAQALAANDRDRPAALTPAYLDALREATLTYLYRLLFVLYAEDRDLLPTRHSGYDNYSLEHRVRARIADRLDAADAFSETADDYDRSLRQLWRQIDRGDRSIGLPPYNGGLFAETRSPLLNRVAIPDAAFAPLFDALSRTEGEAGRLRRRLNYRDLSVQQLGSIYERLLEYELAEEDGAIIVRPQAFARKTSGSYYTPDSLVMLVIRRTVGPLLEERRAAFQAKVAELSSATRPVADRIRELEAHDPASAFLNLKICDPAMGSGHFLVSLVDYLADATLAAIVEAAEGVTFGTYVSPLSARLEAIRARIRTLADENGWAVRDEQLEPRQLVRRMILKRVIYGVDKNPMAVELAKLSLWLHSFTVGAPLSFLDHHLRVGDSLFGEFVRPAMDRLARGGMLANNAVAAAQGAVAGMERVEALTDSDVAEVHQSAEQFRGIEEATAPLRGVLDALQGLTWCGEDIDLSRKALKRKKKERDKAITDGRDAAASRLDAEMRLLERQIAAESLWLEDAFGDTITVTPSFYGKLNDPDPALAHLARSILVAAEENFFHWEVGFPGVWTDWTSNAPGGGFDAIIGNPPWDRIKFQEVEWFAARKRDVALAQTQAERKRRIADLRAAGDPLVAAYDRVVERALQAARVAGQGAKAGGHYPLMGGGDVNLYSLFVERAHRLVKPLGMVGLLVPSGIAGDLGAAPFFRTLSGTGRLAALLDFENRRGDDRPHFFPDVDSRFKFCALVAGGSARSFPAAECAFFLAHTEDAKIAEHSFAMTAADFARVNPNTGTAPIFRTARDAEITSAIYSRVPVLVDRRTDPPTASWPVKYMTMFHMTNDSSLFRTRASLEADGWYKVGNRMKKGAAECVPLYEGKMVQAYDHRAASVVVNPANIHRPGQPEPATAAEHEDPNWAPDPQFYVDAQQAQALGLGEWNIAFKSISAPTNSRTMIAGLLPFSGVGNSMGMVIVEAVERVLLYANLNAFALDFVVRQKIQGQNLNWFIVEQLPILPATAYQRRFGPLSAAELVRREVLHLTYTATDMAAFARDLGHAGEPFPWNETDRRHRRARLDALYMHLYGLGRDEAAYILDTFPIVRAADIAAHVRFLTRDLILAYMNALAAGDVDSLMAT